MFHSPTRRNKKSMCGCSPLVSRLTRRRRKRSSERRKRQCTFAARALQQRSEIAYRSVPKYLSSYLRIRLPHVCPSLEHPYCLSLSLCFSFRESVQDLCANANRYQLNAKDVPLSPRTALAKTTTPHGLLQRSFHSNSLLTLF